ncbi:MAG: type I methionyl aminopeptidase [Eubacterium sp.]|jgi:methionyl aminopeptidase|nr:type I methionyl aminopeptidase [Eubacterium sp.]
MIVVKNSAELARMLKATELSAQVLEYAGGFISSGITTFEINRLIHDFISKHGGKPSFLGYNGFKGSACISVNEELIHGIPSKKKTLNDGDIVSIDVGVYFDGFHGDNAKTFAVGNISGEAQRLLLVTEKSLYEGIKMALPGNRTGDISSAVQNCCELSGYHVVKDYIGHGVGAKLHEEPDVPNFGEVGRGPRLVPGMTLAIEPMVNLTTPSVRILEDGWTVVEANGNLCAHFEHTVAITDGEPLIMTLTSH